MNPPAPPLPTGLVLCGGAGTRLGGVEKPLQPLAGPPLIERVLEALRPQVGCIVISANRDMAAYRRYADRVVDDGAHADCGPLAGLAAGLAAAGTGAVLCVPGDAPLLPPDLARRLAAARADPGIAHEIVHEIAHVHDGDGPQPLCALMDAALAADVRAFLVAGGRAARQWFARRQAVAVDFSDWPRWAWSANTPAEWQAAERHLRERADA